MTRLRIFHNSINLDGAFRAYLLLTLKNITHIFVKTLTVFMRRHFFLLEAYFIIALFTVKGIMHGYPGTLT